MKIIVINGTEQRGCTYAMKEAFLTAMGGGHDIIEYYLPRDCPEFCTGCKSCIYSGMETCPHSRYAMPIWDNILASDLLVFVSPTYVFHLTAQMKALLDHFATKWMAHIPDKSMFGKQAVIITNAIGQGMGKTARDIRDSLDFWGVARTHVLAHALYSGDWSNVSDKIKAKINTKYARTATKIKSATHIKPSPKVKAVFYLMKMAHKMIDRSERKAGRERTTDYLYWKENGWLNGAKPWKQLANAGRPHSGL